MSRLVVVCTTALSLALIAACLIMQGHASGTSSGIVRVHGDELVTVWHRDLPLPRIGEHVVVKAFRDSKGTDYVVRDVTYSRVVDDGTFMVVIDVEEGR